MCMLYSSVHLSSFEAIFEASASSLIDVTKSRIPSITTKPKLGVFSIAYSISFSRSGGLNFLKLYVLRFEGLLMLISTEELQSITIKT